MAKKTPSHRIFQVEERKDRKPFWREIGVAWENADGSYNIDLAVIPLVGQHTVQMRPFDENRQED